MILNLNDFKFTAVLCILTIQELLAHYNYFNQYKPIQKQFAASTKEIEENDYTIKATLCTTKPSREATDVDNRFNACQYTEFLDDHANNNTNWFH